MMILYDNEMSRGHSDGYVVLRAPMDGPMIEVAYGETMIHSTEIVWEMLAQEEWLRCNYDASPMFDIPGSTPVWAPYMIFYSFYDIKIYMYYVFKSICIIKRTLVVFDFILARRYSEKVFDRLWVLKKRLIHKHSIFTVIWYMMVLCLYVYIYSLWFYNLFSAPSSLNLVGFCLLLSSLSTWFCSLPPFPLF